MKTCDPTSFVTVVCLLVPCALGADNLVLVENGRSNVVIFAPGENEWAGRRLADRLLTVTGAHVQLTDAAPSASQSTVIAIGTVHTNPVVQSILSKDARLAGLGEEGYILKTDRWQGRPVLVASGAALAGVNNAVSELVSWKLKLSDKGAAVSAGLDETDRPELKYRLIWTWDGHCNWASTVREMMELYVSENPNVGSTVVPYTPEGFRTHFKRAIDYLSDHKLNGLIVWGFLRDDHGGVEMGREISRYAKQNNVRILPGVCSEAAYGGFIFSNKNKFNLDVWGKQHPELQGQNDKGETVAGAICPSKPENQQWLREGAEWLFTNLPDIGGINLENGDFMTCHTPDCEAERAKTENDPNCFWDMMTTQKPILEVAKRMRPDGWMTFASYVGFTETAARGVSKKSVYPPKFLKQMPENAICQWTFTNMVNSETWPEGARPPDSTFLQHVGLLHHGSVWGTPIDPARWWTAPGAWGDEYSIIMPFICSRIAKLHLGGLVLTGQTGVQSPAHELNYLALEYFGWHPERSYEQFKKERLEPCYGGIERANLFLKLLRNTTKAVSEIERDRFRAVEEARADNLDVRQRARWQNLAGELARRLKKAQHSEEKREDK